jgi:hypothetical protein
MHFPSTYKCSRFTKEETYVLESVKNARVRYISFGLIEAFPISFRNAAAPNLPPGVPRGISACPHGEHRTEKPLHYAHTNRHLVSPCSGTISPKCDDIRKGAKGNALRP